MLKKLPTGSYYFRDTKRGICVALQYDYGKGSNIHYKLYLARTTVAQTDIEEMSISMNEVLGMIDKAAQANRKVIFKVNGMLGKVGVRDLRRELPNIYAVVSAQPNIRTKKRKL